MTQKEPPSFEKTQCNFVDPMPSDFSHEENDSGSTGSSPLTVSLNQDLDDSVVKTATSDQAILQQASCSLNESKSSCSEEICLKKPHEEARLSSMHDAYSTFIKQMEGLSDMESKLSFVIEFMENSLSQSGSPQFRCFWEAQKLCLGFFKENIAPSMRVSLWARYSELCREARRLKEIFDEQSSFAAEQIDIAVKGLEEEVEKVAEHVHALADPKFPLFSSFLSKHQSLYYGLQKELNFLNAYAARINALRKELIKTEMRVKQKNKFFERLSNLGDKVFPRRKHLIKEVSQLFSKDIEDFIQVTFVGELKGPQLYQAREEIKSLQGVAKTLTLNNEVFSQTRTRLSECWDSIKHIAKEHKKGLAQQKIQFKQNKDIFSAEIIKLKTEIESHSSSSGVISEKIDALTHRIREAQLGKDEIRGLRDELKALRDVANEQSMQEETARKKVQQHKEYLISEKREHIRSKIQALINKAQELSVEQLESSRDEIQKEINNSNSSRLQKQSLEQSLRSIRDLISDKKEQQLLNLSSGDRQTLEQLNQLLKQRREHRQQIKMQLDAYKKLGGSSGLDFTQAMHYNDLVEAERQSLEKVETSIEDLEAQIEDLEK